MTKNTILLIFVMFFTIDKIYPQCCSGGVPISGTLGLSTSDSQSWQFLLTYDYNAMNDLFEGSQSLDDNSRKRSTQSILFEVNYGLTKRITLTAMSTFVRQERLVSTIDDQSNFTSTQGLGDGIFLVKYRLISPDENQNYSFSIGGGPKIPIGRTDFTNQIGLALPADLQPGSGAWDLLLWSNFERYHLFLKNFNVAAVLTYRYTGTNNNYFSVQKYRFGNEFIASFQTSYRFFVRSQIFDGTLTFMYRNQQEDLVNGETFPNSGGNFLYLIPGLNYNFSPDFSFRLSGYVPLYRNPGGTQVTTSYKLTAAIAYTIRKKSIKILPN